MLRTVGPWTGPQLRMGLGDAGVEECGEGRQRIPRRNWDRLMGNSRGVCGRGQTVEHQASKVVGPLWQSDGNPNLARRHQASMAGALHGNSQLARRSEFAKRAPAKQAGARWVFAEFPRGVRWQAGQRPAKRVASLAIRVAPVAHFLAIRFGNQMSTTG